MPGKSFKNDLGYNDNYKVPLRALSKTDKLAVMNRLLQLWLQHPDLRLMQLIVGAVGENAYKIEDFDLITTLEKGYEREHRSNQQSNPETAGHSNQG